MDPDRRPQGGSVVVREAPQSGGGGLLYLARDAEGRLRWTRDPGAAERHASLREASRAALTAPSAPGSTRPAFAVPLSVADDAPPPLISPPRRRLALGEPQLASEPVRAADPWTGGALWMVDAWSAWVEAWSALLFRREGGGRT